MFRSWKDQFQDREVSPVQSNQSCLDLGKIDIIGKAADRQTDRQTDNMKWVRYICSTRTNQ